MISTVRHQLLAFLSLGCLLAFAADGLGWLSPVPARRRDELAKRLDAYVNAHRSRDWATLFDLMSKAGRGAVSRQMFAEKMNAAHRRDVVRSADLLAFRPGRSMDRGDSAYDVYGCGKARREALDYNGIAVIHAVYEHNEWFFSGWMFTELPNESCEPLTDPSWEPPGPEDWDQVIEELGGPPRWLMNDPVFGIVYDPHRVRFENAPPSLGKACAADLRNQNAYWLFAYWKEADTEYLLTSSQRASVSGGAAVIRGIRCTLGLPDWLLTGERRYNPDAGDTSILFSSRVLHGLAKDLLNRYSKAFGGKDPFLAAVRNLKNFSSGKDLPPILRTEFQAFSKQ
jgi:hypothetical protein